VVGFIFYNTESFEPMEEFVTSFHHDTEAISNAAYNASILAVNPSKAFDPADFDFCTLSHGSCSIIAFNVFDSNRAISPYSYLLPQTSCYDTFTTPHFDMLVEIPPFPLVEQFYECTDNTQTAFEESLGIAVGNAMFWVPLILICCLPLVYAFLNLYKNAPSTKLEYGDDEMEEAARHIGLVLLRVRDGYFQSYGSELVAHCTAIMQALKADPVLASPLQIRQLQRGSGSGSGSRPASNRQGASRDDSDDDVDPIDDIA
jgi:hypothetical protein